MKKTLAIILVVMLLSMAMVSAVSAVGEEMTAKKGTPVIDGEIDAIWAEADRQELTHVKAGDLKDIAPEVEKAYASALWDENYIYFLFEVTDDDVTNAFGGDPTAQEWKNDTIFLYIDEEATRSTSLWIDGTYQFSFCFDGTAKLPRNGGTYTKETKYAAKQTDTGFIIEVAFAPEIIKLAAGVELGVDYQYNDGTEAGTRDYCLGWSDETDGASGNASIWGFLTLSADAVGGAAAAEPVAADPAPVADAPVEKGAIEEAPAAVVTAPVSAPATTVSAAPQTGDTLVIVLSVLALIGACGIVASRKTRI